MDSVLIPTGKYKGQPVETVPYGYLSSQFQKQIRSKNWSDPILCQRISDVLADPKYCKMTFGKYRDMIIQDVPLQYLRWLERNKEPWYEAVGWYAPFCHQTICRAAIVKRLEAEKNLPDVEEEYMQFGQYKGRPLSELSASYINWLLTQKLTKQFRASLEAVLPKAIKAAEAASQAIKDDFIAFLDK